MSSTTSNAKQEFTYSLKTVALSNAPEFSDPGQLLCGSELWFRINPPDKYIQLKRLRFRAIIQFDSTIPTANQTISQIGITDSAVTGLTGATYTKLVPLPTLPDANRRLFVNIDLTSLLKPATDNNFYVYMLFPQSYPTGGAVWDGTNGGEVLLCKVDALYTTTGIR